MLRNTARRLAPLRPLAGLIPSPPVSHASLSLSPSDSYSRFVSLSLDLAEKRRQRDIDADREKYEQAFRKASAGKQPQQLPKQQLHSAEASSTAAPSFKPPAKSAKSAKSAPKYLVDEIVASANANKSKSSARSKSPPPSPSESSAPSLDAVVLDVHRAGVSPNFDYNSPSSSSSSSVPSPSSLGVEDPTPYLLSGALGGHPQALQSYARSLLDASLFLVPPSPGTTRDVVRRGLEIMLEAAEGGDGTANLHVSEMLQEPRHKAVEEVLAERLTDAEDFGRIRALQDALATPGVEKNSAAEVKTPASLASHYLSRAASLGSFEASYRLGASLLSKSLEEEDAEVASVDEKRGLELLRKAAKEGMHGKSADYLLFYLKTYTDYYDDPGGGGDGLAAAPSHGADLSSSPSSFTPSLPPPPPGVVPPSLSRYGRDLLSTFLHYQGSAPMAALRLAEYYADTEAATLEMRKRDGILANFGDGQHGVLAARAFLTAAKKGSVSLGVSGPPRDYSLWAKDGNSEGEVSEADDEGRGAAAVSAGALFFNGEERTNDEPEDEGRKNACGHGDGHHHDGCEALERRQGREKSYEELLEEEEDVAGKCLRDLGGLAVPDDWHYFASGLKAGGRTLVKRDRHTAFLLYQLGGELGEVEGWRNVAACYFLGEGVEKCEKSARYILDVMVKPVDEMRRRQAESGDSDSINYNQSS